MGIHSVESCGVLKISLGQQHQDNHGEASQWLVAPWGDWWHHGVTGFCPGTSPGDWFMSCSI